MVSKKDFFKNKLQQITPAGQLFSTVNIDMETLKKGETKKLIRNKKNKKSEEYSRVNLLMPSDLKKKAEILAKDYKGAGNLSKLIIEQLEHYVKDNDKRLKILMDK